MIFVIKRLMKSQNIVKLFYPLARELLGSALN